MIQVNGYDKYNMNKILRTGYWSKAVVARQDKIRQLYQIHKPGKFCGKTLKYYIKEHCKTERQIYM